MPQGKKGFVGFRDRGLGFSVSGFQFTVYGRGLGIRV